MASQDPKTFLWSNIALLMGTASPTVDAVQRKTQVGRGTVQRIKEGSTSTGTDTLLAIADAFGVEPWELLQPQLGKKTATLDANKATSPTLAQALDVVLDAMAQSTAKAELKQLLPMLVETNAAAYRARLGELLGQSLQKQPSIADKLLAIPSEVESPRLSQRATEK